MTTMCCKINKIKQPVSLIGCCCCECHCLAPVYLSHCDEVLGYVCLVGTIIDASYNSPVYWKQNQHGICEMFEPKKQDNDVKDTYTPQK